MGKLVLFLKDASPVEIPLAKERVTIGRRADNDVCLPNPAVSGEHAAVVTILADSFLEDLGSTNGTLVNGKPIAKHFLRDRDQIDIGRQLLVYLADVDARAVPPAEFVPRDDRRELAQRVEPVRPPERVEPALASAIDEDLGIARTQGARSAPSRAEHAWGRTDAPPTSSPTHRIPTEGTAEETTFDAEFASSRHLGTDPAPASEPPARNDAPAVLRGRVRVLTGPSAGRVVEIACDDFVVGRVGVQVASIRWRDGTLCLVPGEGAAPPTINGEPVPPEGRPLASGDAIEVAGTRLELVIGG